MDGRGFTEDQAKASLDQGGFTAQEALKAKMVDRLMYPDDITDGLKELTGKRVWSPNGGKQVRNTGRDGTNRDCSYSDFGHHR